MLISEKRRNTPKLSREIMGLLCITAAIALFFFGFLYLTANAIASTYLLENDILLTEGQLLTLQGGIRSLSRDLETIEDGKLLMEQLAGEWEEILENTFPCIVDTKNCPAFYGSFDIQELRRIFDNLASNVEKYADREQPVELRIDAVDKRLRVCQRNGIKTGTVPVESNQIGLESIRRIAALYGGMVKVSIEQGIFSIQITLSEVDGSHL